MRQKKKIHPQITPEDPHLYQLKSWFLWKTFTDSHPQKDEFLPAAPCGKKKCFKKPFLEPMPLTETSLSNEYSSYNSCKRRCHLVWLSPGRARASSPTSSLGVSSKIALSLTLNWSEERRSQKGYRYLSILIPTMFVPHCTDVFLSWPLHCEMVV